VKAAAVVFDLGGTLVHWPEWETGAAAKWGASYDALVQAGLAPPDRETYVHAMRGAELAHWRRVDHEHWSGPPTLLVAEGFRALGIDADEVRLLAALDGYAAAVGGWSQIFPDAVETLRTLRERGLRLGLLSNTWWAAEWHNADLAAHGLSELLDELVYTSDLPHSKPHPSVFREVARRLGVEPREAVMVGDRMIDDVAGAQAIGMLGIWKRNDATPVREDIKPDAIVETLADVPHLVPG
jgi:putative hydrolase of the HAD superfamily